MTIPDIPVLPPHISSIHLPPPDDNVPELAPVWFYVDGGDQVRGPLSLVDFETMSHAMDGLSLVWRYGFSSWKPLSEVIQVKEFLRLTSDSQGIPPTNGSDHSSSVEKAEDQRKTEEKKSRNRETRLLYKERQRLKRLETNNASVYVSGLSESTSAEEVEELFKGAGQIDLTADLTPRIKMYKNEDGSLKGDALITFRDPVSKDIAVKYYNGRVLNGSTIEVSVASFNYAKNVSKREPASKKHIKEVKKRKHLIDVELRRRQGDLCDMSSLYDSKQKSFGVVVKGLWSSNQASRWSHEDPVYRLFGEILLLCLSRKSMTKGLAWGAWQGIKNVKVLGGHRDGLAIVYLKDQASAESLVDAIQNTDLPWGYVRDCEIKGPLPTANYIKMEYEYETLKSEHNTLESYPHVVGVDHGGQMVDNIESATNEAWILFIANAKEALLPRKEASLVPFARCWQEKDMDPMIRLQRRIYAFEKDLPLLSQMLTPEEVPPTSPVEEIKSDRVPEKLEDWEKNLDNFMDAAEQESSDDEFQVIEEL
eukprot:GHVH01017490.1.p1 GENE.GHVH01017490.1~~GHVH01017490.1.p1  ORF type:complete len:536 (+),score=93.19 GHVH01017490.1:1319-2926(+)